MKKCLVHAAFFIAQKVIKTLNSLEANVAGGLLSPIYHKVTPLRPP